ncbi:L,D-transpeptidase family protein [Microbacterium timonense]|uniref:L,D-transpeptidase family protein n=1 Tax=Microbacterium timonense TaxID=2086576 RepID=UPI000D10ADD3|nr:L,D-transpeptidase family protein [Microbacterium timonense]
MTDLATEPQAGQASGDDAVEAEQAVEDEASTTGDHTTTDDRTEGSGPAEGATDTPADAAPPADAASPGDAESPADAASPADAESPADAASDVSPATPLSDATAAAADGATDATAATTVLPADGSPVYAWAPAEPQPKKRHTALWISAAAGVAVVGLVVSSLVLIAPGTSVAGVPVGWLTPGAAADAISQRLAETTVVLTGAGDDVEVTGAELGATVDARALADAAFAEHPMWNPTTWFSSPGDAAVELDPATATETLRAAAPQLYTDPVDATIDFDAASASYVSTPAEPGTGIDVAAVEAALQSAFESGQTRVEFDPVTADVPADLTTEIAEATVAQLNGMLDTVGFYVGDERTVPVDRAVAASWLTIAPGDGEFTITADASAIQPIVDTLPAAVDRAPENALVITDTAGKVLREIAGGQSGRTVGDTSGVADAFAAQLSGGDAVYKLPVEEVPVGTTTLARNIVVDLSEQRTYIYENGQVVNSFLISSGTAATPTHTGNFRINSHIRVQDMGALCYNPNAVNSYCTKNVPWVMYFNGDQGFHGTYWHNNFGNRMSHGCVNLPLSTAEFLYTWAPNGTEVRVQA